MRDSRRRARSFESETFQQSKRAKGRRKRGEMAEKRTSAERTASATKCDYRSIANRAATRKSGRRGPISAENSETPKKALQISASPKPDNAAGDYSDAAIAAMERNQDARIFALPLSCFLLPEYWGRRRLFFPFRRASYGLQRIAAENPPRDSVEGRVAGTLPCAPFG